MQIFRVKEPIKSCPVQPKHIIVKFLISGEKHKILRDLKDKNKLCTQNQDRMSLDFSTTLMKTRNQWSIEES